MALTPLETIKSRIKAGQWMMQEFSLKDQRAIGRYLDPTGLTIGNRSPMTTSETSAQAQGRLPLEGGEGQVPFLTINTLTKVANVAINDPDFDVECGEGAGPDDEEITRQSLKDLWEKEQWAFEDQATELQASIAGMGFQVWGWGQEGPFFRQKDTWDLAIDPHTTKTTWHKMRHFAYRVRMPYADVKARYPSTYKRALTVIMDEGTVDYEQTACDIWIYFDSTTEAHLYGGNIELYRDDNLYGAVPLLVLPGEVNPDSPFHMGDFDLATTLQEFLSGFMDALVDQAKNGGSITVYNEQAIDTEGSEDELLEGNDSPQLNAVIGITGVPPDEAIHRIPSEPINPALLEAFQVVRRGLDEATAIGEYERGVPLTSGRTATESAIISQQSSARKIATKATFERFVNAKVRILLKMLRDFGQTSTDEDFILWQALNKVTKVRVVESSTTFRDPAIEQQAAMQLLQLAITAFPVMAQTGTLLNLRAFTEDVLRAFQKRDVKRYFIDPQQAMEMQQQQMLMQQQAGQAQGQPGMPPGGSSSPAQPAQSNNGTNTQMAPMGL